jgi:transcriptional regulator with XRE-family HTH domain
MAEMKPKKPKFKYTRELVRIAIADGMTQKQIGDLCRVEQSVVSGWLNGKSLAFEHQIAELKKRYGNRLNRTTSRVYLTLGEAPSTPRWEDTERARRLLNLRNLGNEGEVERERQRLLNEIRPNAPYHTSIKELIQADREDFVAAQRSQRERLEQVEGPIALRYTFVKHKLQMRRDAPELERVPVARWLVHHQPSGRFVLVHQERRVLEGQARWRWRQAVMALAPDNGSAVTGRSLEHKLLTDDPPYIESADDAARWLSFVHGPMDAAALLAHSDAYFKDSKTLHGPHDERTLPFLLRKMLVEHGHDVPGLVRLSDSE